MTVYSVSMFFNEFEVFRAKVHEERRGGIEKFLVSEADKTFRGAAKPRWLHQWRWYYPEVTIVPVDGLDFVENPWYNENLQRESAISEIDIKKDDIFFVADADEIFHSYDIPTLCGEAMKYGVVKVDMRHYYYYINTLFSEHWMKPFVCTGDYLLRTGLDLSKIRLMNAHVVETRGRHFGYLHDSQGLRFKMKSFSHAELDRSEIVAVDRLEARRQAMLDPLGKKILDLRDLDDSYPRAILDKATAWRKHCYHVDTAAKIETAIHDARAIDNLMAEDELGYLAALASRCNRVAVVGAPQSVVKAMAALSHDKITCFGTNDFFGIDLGPEIEAGKAEAIGCGLNTDRGYAWADLVYVEQNFRYDKTLDILNVAKHWLEPWGMIVGNFARDEIGVKALDDFGKPWRRVHEDGRLLEIREDLI